MAKTRTLTATFPNGEQVTRKTARTYTHVVRAFVNAFGDRPVVFAWCGRPDLMEKKIKNAQKWQNEGLKIEIAKITNDPWAE